MISRGRVSTVCTKEKIERNLDLWGPIARTSFLSRTEYLEPGTLALEVRSSQLVVKEESHIGHLLKLVEKPFVETGPVHSTYVPAVNVVSLRRLNWVTCGGQAMDHSAMHWDRLGDDVVKQLRVGRMTKGIDATF